MFDSIPGLIGGFVKMAIDGSLPSSIAGAPIVKWLLGNISDTSTPPSGSPVSSGSLPTSDGRYSSASEAIADGWKYVGNYYYEKDGQRKYYDDIIQ